MKLLQNNSLTLWIGLAAAASLAATALAGCTRDPFEDEGRRPSDLPRVEITLGLALPQMVAASPENANNANGATEQAAASGAAANVTNAANAAARAANPAVEVSETDAMAIVFGGSGAEAGHRSAEAVGAATSATASATAVAETTAETVSILTPAAMASASATRAGETDPTAVEQLVRGVWIVQFDGTTSASKLVACDYYDGNDIVDNRLPVSVAEVSGTMRLYAVANVGETRFESLAVGSTTLGEFEASACDIGVMDIAQAAASGLPMVGRYDGTLADLQPEILLQRMVAKVTVSCTASVPSSEKFLVRSSQILSAPTRAAYAAPAVPAGTSGLYPDAAQTANFADAPARALTEGMQAVWYVPENLRGVVAGITAATDKNASKAPKASTVLEISGDYTKNDEVSKATYRLYLGQNLTTDFNLVRNHVYTVSVTVKGLSSSDSRVEQTVAEDLTANGVTANCYIANTPGGVYKFNAKVMGNGATTPEFDGGNGGVPADPITPQALTPTSVRVLWETGSKQGGVIPSVALNGAGEVSFSVGGLNGGEVPEANALIGVFNGGTLLWSWHIWVTSYDPETSYDSYASGYDVMQYNLGADATSDEGTVGRFGLLYQWGRKDPFIGANATTGTTAATTVNDADFPWVNELASKSGQEQIEYAIQNPTKFLYRDTNVTDYWDWASDSENTRIDNLWGNPNATNITPNPSIGEKSIYDPCPSGWRVAPANTWTFFTSTGQNTSIKTEVNATTYNGGWNFHTYGWLIGPTTFYPSCGYRSNVGTLTLVGTRGNYWSSSPFANNSPLISRININETGANPLSEYHRVVAYPIRCVRDENPHGATSTVINLSAHGTANSYIVGKAGTAYRFNAKVMGNGATTAPFNAPSGGVSAPAIQPKVLAPASAQVLWETGSVKGGIIKSVTVENGYVVFTTAGNAGAAATEGNALIGVFDASGTLIWSWHIWSTSYDPNTNFDTYTNHAGKKYDVMQYNLGANATSDVGTVGRFGLYYQWGRKDPFIGPAATSGTAVAVTTPYNQNYAWKTSPSTSLGTVADAIKNPTTFIITSDRDWLSGNRIDNLWGNPSSSTSTNSNKGAKSIYDPCPPGWRVPPQDTWTGFTSTGANSTTAAQFNVYKTFNKGWNFHITGETSGTYNFYPATGYRNSSAGTLDYVGTSGYYWSSSPYTNNNTSVGYLYFLSNNVSPLFSSPRAYGFSVRCCKE